MCSKATSSISRNRGRGNGPVHARGVTLVELVVVLTLLGVIAAVAAIALRDPIRAYVDTNRRAQLTDIADTALRRMARDIRLALPNSVRVTGAGPMHMELLLTRTGGRYRAQGDGGTAKALDLTAPDTCFDTLGPVPGAGTPASQAIVAGDIVVVHNLFSASGVTTSNAYTYNQSPYCSTANSSTCNTAQI